MARFYAVVAVLALAVACGHTAKRNGDGPSSTGGVSGNVGGGVDGGGGAGGESVEPCAPGQPPEVPLRALREAELTNELGVFGESLAGEVFPEPFSYLFEPGPEPEPKLQFVRGHADFVADLARRVVANSAGLSELLGCKVAPTPAADCESKLFDFVIRRLFRGRKDEGTLAELQQLFDTGQELGGDFASGVQAVLEVALQSPEFLYRIEQGRPATDYAPPWGQPTDLEMASRLSFLLWDRGPDDELLTLAATEGALSVPADLETQARRLLADERSRGPVRRFYRELMQSKDVKPFDTEVPEFDENVQALMDQEFASFVDHVTFGAPNGLGALFSPVTWVNGPLARFYGWPNVEGDSFQGVDLDPQRYAGLLTQPAWLTRASFPRFSNPSERGWVVARALRCLAVPPEPDLGTIPAPTMPGATSRQRADEHAVSPSCAACHRFVDPIGFGLEHFDATGRYRETENDLVIDASGQLQPDGAAFDGAAELASALLNAPETRDCYVTQWTRFAFGQAEEQANECTRAVLREQFANDDNVVELLVALTQTRSFRFRKQTGGTLP